MTINFITFASRAQTILLLVLLNACNSPNQQPPPDTGFTLPYQLDLPDTSFELPPELREFSGLCLSPDGAQLLAVNDEQGIVFHLSIQTGAIEQQQDFGKNGDYEGITTAGKDIYVVKSTGTLYRISEDGKTKSYPTPLNAGNDVEGLCYDPANNRLLLACKGHAGKGDNFRNKKSVYAFDLEEKTLAENPAYMIDRAEIARWKGGSTGILSKWSEFLETDQAPSAFGPSGLDISPIDSNLYLLAAVGKTLAVLHPNGRLLSVQRLNASRFQQPEAICFDLEGRLYLGSEGGKGRSARIFRFDLKK